MPASTRTAVEAARAIGCDVGQIAKSLIFRCRESGTAVLVVASGPNRVNPTRMAEYVGERIELADAGFCRQATGFAIGGVPPVGHTRALPTFIDKDLMQLAEIWAAAGTPHAVFSVSPADLVRITKGRVVPVK